MARHARRYASRLGSCRNMARHVTVEREATLCPRAVPEALRMFCSPPPFCTSRPRHEAALNVAPYKGRSNGLSPIGADGLSPVKVLPTVGSPPLRFEALGVPEGLV